MNALTNAEIDDLVQSYLDKQQPPGCRLTVDSRGTRQDDDWWYVVVVPDRNGIRVNEYADRLTEVEERLRDEKEIKLLLVPTLVDD